MWNEFTLILVPKKIIYSLIFFIELTCIKSSWIWSFCNYIFQYLAGKKKNCTVFDTIFWVRVTWHVTWKVACHMTHIKINTNVWLFSMGVHYCCISKYFFNIFFYKVSNLNCETIFYFYFFSLEIIKHSIHKQCSG